MENEKKISEYDLTKQMLNTIREYTNPIGSGNVNNNDMIELSSQERSVEEDKFRETVSPKVQFTVFNIYPDDNNVVFGGKFMNLNGLEWQLTLEEDNGIFLNCEGLQLTPQVLNILQKLNGYYENWSEEWAEKLGKEYKNKSDGEE